MIYSNGTISINGNTATGSGTNWTAPASQVRAGQTIIVMSNPVQLFQISSVNSATSMTVTPAASPALSGQKYGILVSDIISVDGLAQAMSQLIKEYDENIGAWETFASTSANQLVTVTINGTSLSIPAIGGLARKGVNSDITELKGLSTALSITQGGTGGKNATDAANNIGVGPASYPLFSGATVSTTGYAILGAQNTSREATDVGARVHLEASIAANAPAVIIQRNNQNNQTGQIRSVLPSTSGTLAVQGTSGRDYKKNISPANPEEALGRILALELVNFVYKDDEKDRQRFGIIAEDAEVIAPQYIKHNQEPIPGTEVFNEDGHKIGEEFRDRPSVDNNPIVMDLIGCIHGLQRQITDLRQELVD
ncbi:tail fiber domain-containing protein [Escherichia coli]|nr:tail fiber domain-containing protein [Escherichia coli]ELM7730399.1 tail fiber domain-containing protein [Escherichia coli]ELM7764082.1 tail fiber domain-containing protein [Escherichia coli]ELM7768879.1 tail fiber domain-containing protein [Escherichia coli]